MRKGPIDRRLSAQAGRAYLPVIEAPQIAEQSIPAFLRAIATKIERGELSMMRCMIVGEDPDGKILLYGRRPLPEQTDDIKLLWERITSAWGLTISNATEAGL